MIAIKNILQTKNIIKRKRKPKNLKQTLTSSSFGEKKHRMESENVKIKGVEYVI